MPRKFTICRVPDCNKPANPCGECHMHYKRRRRFGSYELPPKPTCEERFWQQVSKTEGCWEWLGSPHGEGYGLFRVNGKQVLTHRYAYELQHGRIPDGLWVLHKCDNRRCVRGDHLFLGTVFENNEDMYRKGRHAHGEAHPGAKLTTETVQAIRTAYAAGGVTMKQLAAHYGVAASQIHNAIHGLTWKEVA
jgi:hypothetical protein